MNRKPLSAAALTALAVVSTLALGCDQDQGSAAPPALTTTTTSADEPPPEREIAPPPDDQYQEDRRAVGRCCAALQNKYRTTSGEERGAYAMALGVCMAERRTRKGKDHALEKIRKSLGDKKPPGACRSLKAAAPTPEPLRPTALPSSPPPPLEGPADR